MRALVAALFWLVASKLVEWAVAVNPPLVRRVLEADGVALAPGKPVEPRRGYSFPIVETLYARPLTPAEAADIARRSVLGLRAEARA
jgi:hypothetical protein